MREGGRDSALIGAPVNPYKYGMLLGLRQAELARGVQREWKYLSKAKGEA